jgi:hypothetical protein
VPPLKDRNTGMNHASQDSTLTARPKDTISKRNQQMTANSKQTRGDTVRVCGQSNLTALKINSLLHQQNSGCAHLQPKHT